MKLKIRRGRVEDLCWKADREKGTFHDLISGSEKLQTLGMRIQS